MAFERKIDKKQIPTCKIMGVNLAVIDMKWLVDFLNKNISDLYGDYICVSNVCPSKNLLETSPQG